MKVANAFNHSSLLFGAAKRGQEHARKDAYNADDGQELNERESYLGPERAGFHAVNVSNFPASLHRVIFEEDW